MITNKKSSNLSVTPLAPVEGPANPPIMNSGDKSMEKIKIYKAISVLIKATVKTATATTAQIKTGGEYCEASIPMRMATGRSNKNKKNDLPGGLKLIRTVKPSPPDKRFYFDTTKYTKKKKMWGVS